MNILLYFRNQLHPNTGGTERVAVMLVDYLQKSGHNVFCLALYKSDFPKAQSSYFLPNNVDLISLENIEFVNKLVIENNIDIIINEDVFSGATDLFSHKYIPKSVNIYSHLHFDPESGDKSFYQTLDLPISGVSVKTKVINILKWVKSPYNKFKGTRKRRNRLRKVYEGSDSIVVLSPEYRESLMRCLNLKTSSKIVAIQNPLTFEYVGEDLIEKDNLIIYVGRLTYTQKRVDRILKVWSNLHTIYKNWKLTIVGDGEDRARLDGLSRNLRLYNCDFVGHVDPKEYYKKAKILLLTSNFEGTPMVIFEAMSYGVVPVVMDSFGAIHSMIKDNYNGLIVKSFNLEEMSDKLNDIITDTVRIETLSMNARTTVKQMDNEKLLGKWEDLLL